MNATRAASGCVHAVTFYDGATALARTVADFFEEGLAIGERGLIIAPLPHRDAFAAELRARHINLDAREEAGDLLVLDAYRTLETVMVNGRPDPERFRAATLVAVHGLARGSSDRQIRAYGETVDVLWRGGQRTAALELERLWNDLGASTGGFSLLCGYAIASFYAAPGMREILRAALSRASLNAAVGDSGSGVTRSSTAQASLLHSSAEGGVPFT